MTTTEFGPGNGSILVTRSLMNWKNKSVSNDPSMIVHSMIPLMVMAGSIEYLPLEDQSSSRKRKEMPTSSLEQSIAFGMHEAPQEPMLYSAGKFSGHTRSRRQRPTALVRNFLQY